MSLQVVVIKATNVPNAEKFGESDPYVSFEFNGKFTLHVIPGVNSAVYSLFSTF
jgi:Ca2+-dependent lipid-binding protein